MADDASEFDSDCIGEGSGQEQQRPERPLRHEGAEDLRVECGGRGSHQP